MTGIASAGRGPREPDRGVSTVLDVALFLLLVGAAIGLLYAAPQADPPDRDADVAAETVTTLSTATATVTYEPAGDEPVGGNWSARGTVTEHLAAAAVANATLDGRPLRRADGYDAAVHERTRTVLTRVGADTDVQVRAVWEPLPGSGLRGEVVVGRPPPPDADVHAATVTVPVASARDGGIAAPGWEEAAGGWPGQRNASSDDSAPEAGGSNRTDDHPGPATFAGESVAAPTNRSLAEIADRQDCDALARAIARRVVGTTFPPDRTQAALRAGGRPRERTVERYRTAAAAVDGPVDDLPVDDARTANALLVAAYADELRPSACSYDSPVAAARAASPDTVTVSVRTWSP